MDNTGQITPERFAQLTGIPVARLRQLAAEGFFPKALEGNYKLSDALSGILRYYRESSQKLPVYDSIDQCVGATGISRSVIKIAKKAGCDAFSSNRVHLAKLLAWMFDPKNGSKGATLTIDDFKRKKVQEEARLLELKRQKAERELVSVEDVKRWTAEAVYATKVVLLSVPGKLAPQVVGLPIAEAEIRLRDAVHEALMKLHRDPWPKAPTEEECF